MGNCDTVSPEEREGMTQSLESWVLEEPGSEPREADAGRFRLHVRMSVEHFSYLCSDVAEMNTGVKQGG